MEDRMLRRGNIEDLGKLTNDASNLGEHCIVVDATSRSQAKRAPLNTTKSSMYCFLITASA